MLNYIALNTNNISNMKNFIQLCKWSKDHFNTSRFTKKEGRLSLQPYIDSLCIEH